MRNLEHRIESELNLEVGNKELVERPIRSGIMVIVFSGGLLGAATGLDVYFVEGG